MRPDNDPNSTLITYLPNSLLQGGVDETLARYASPSNRYDNVTKNMAHQYYKNIAHW